jgi:aspartate/methionine/tyrosine aminotransferase
MTEASVDHPRCRSLRTVRPFLALDMLREAQRRQTAGETVLRLEAGQPVASLPSAVTAALTGVLAAGHPFPYTEAKGLLSLRRAIAAHTQRQYGVGVDPERILITPGSSGAFILAFLAAFRPGDRVGVMAPGYPAYTTILEALDIVPVPLRAEEGSRWQLTPDILAAAKPLQGVILASPANPTGTMLTPDALRDLVRWCDRQGIRVISDELYHGITYGTETATAAAFSDQACAINSFSKYFAMTGWRLGWLVAPVDLISALEALMQSLFIAAPTPSQLAGEAALGCLPEFDAHVVRYRENRDILLDGLQRWGVRDMAPADGAFYIYADLSPFTSDSLAFCQRLLEQHSIAATAGVDFDRSGGKTCVRFSYAGETATVQEAVRRLVLVKSDMI